MSSPRQSASLSTALVNPPLCSESLTAMNLHEIETRLRRLEAKVEGVTTPPPPGKLPYDVRMRYGQWGKPKPDPDPDPDPEWPDGPLRTRCRVAVCGRGIEGAEVRFENLTHGGETAEATGPDGWTPHVPFPSGSTIRYSTDQPDQTIGSGTATRTNLASNTDVSIGFSGDGVTTACLLVPIPTHNPLPGAAIAQVRIRASSGSPWIDMAQVGPLSWQAVSGFNTYSFRADGSTWRLFVNGSSVAPTGWSGDNPYIISHTFGQVEITVA